MIRDTFPAAYKPILEGLIIQDIKDHPGRSRRIRQADFVSLAVAMQELVKIMGPLEPELTTMLYRTIRGAIDRSSTMNMLIRSNPEAFDGLFEAIRGEAALVLPTIDWDATPGEINGY